MPLAARKLLSLSLSVSVWKKNFNCYFDRIFWCNLGVEFIPIYIVLIFENRLQVDQLSEKIQAWGKSIGRKFLHWGWFENNSILNVNTKSGYLSNLVLSPGKSFQSWDKFCVRGLDWVGEWGRAGGKQLFLFIFAQDSKRCLSRCSETVIWSGSGELGRGRFEI